MVFEFRLGICGLFYTCFILRFCNSARNELSTRYVEFKIKKREGAELSGYEV